MEKNIHPAKTFCNKFKLIRNHLEFNQSIVEREIDLLMQVIILGRSYTLEERTIYPVITVAMTDAEDRMDEYIEVNLKYMEQ